MDRLIRLLAALLLVPLSLEAQDDGIQRFTRELVPAVERAVGLTFKRPPRVAGRSPQQVRAYLDHKLAEQMPPAEIAAVERTYRAFHLVPDTLDLRRAMLDLYSEQVAGFYDPDSSTLFVVRGSGPMMMRVVLAHELVHALQDQYTRLNVILKMKRHNDRQMAGQAVMEGQATVASLRALAPEGTPPDFSQAWGAIREGLRQQQSAMPVFAAAPHFIQESLLFPYLAGGEFISGFDSRRVADEQPWNERLPISTEQILHAGKYTAREAPRAVSIAPVSGDTSVNEDDFGEFETRTALESWGVDDATALAAAAGWNGDRYVVLGDPAGTAIVWASAWDTPEDAAEFERALRQAWTRVARSRRWQIDVLTLGGVKVVRLVDAPQAWRGWARLPAIRLTQ